MKKKFSLLLPAAALCALASGLHAQTIFDWNITSDPPNGDWDTTTANWSDDGGATPTTWVNGNNTARFDGTVIGLTGPTITVSLTEDITLGRLELDNFSGNEELILDAAALRTLTFTGDNHVIQLANDGSVHSDMRLRSNVRIESDSLTLDGANTRRELRVESDNDATLTGTVTVDGANWIMNGGTANGVSTWDVRSGGWLTMASGGSALGDSSVIELRGKSKFEGAGGETVGTLAVQNFGEIDGTFTTTDLDRNKKGIVGLLSGNTITWTNHTITGSDSDVLGWMPTAASQFGYADSSGVLQIATSTDQNDLSQFTSATDNYRLLLDGTANGGVTNSIAAGTTINTLGIDTVGGNPGTVTIQLDGALTIDDGGVTFESGGSTNAQPLITGGSITSGKSDLYFTIYRTRGGSTLTIESPIVGGINVVYGGAASPDDFTVSGASANTYTGETHVGTWVDFEKTGGAISIPGDLVILEGGTANLEDSTQIVTTSNVTVNGTFNSSGATVASVDGTGVIGEDLTVTSSLAPGNSIGTLTVDGDTLTMDAGSSMDFEIGSLSSYDRLEFLNDGALTLDGSLDLNIIDFGGSGIVAGDYELFAFYTDGGSTLQSLDTSVYASSISLIGDAPAGSSLDFSQDGIIGLTVIPEPASFALLAGAFGLSLVMLRRRRA